MKRDEPIEPEVSTNLSDDLDIDLGLETHIAAILDDTDGVDTESTPIIIEQITLMILVGELFVALLRGDALDREDLRSHVSTIMKIQKGQLLRLAELVNDND